MGTIDPTTASYLTAKAWIVSDYSSIDSALITTSMFTPMGKADRWAITPAFMVTSSNMLLIWEDKQLLTYGGITYTDELEILVGNSSAATPAAFTSLGKTVVSPFSLGLKKKGVNLSAYVGQNVRIALGLLVIQRESLP